MQASISWGLDEMSNTGIKILDGATQCGHKVGQSLYVCEVMNWNGEKWPLNDWHFHSIWSLRPSMVVIYGIPLLPSFKCMKGEDEEEERESMVVCRSWWWGHFGRSITSSILIVMATPQSCSSTNTYAKKGVSSMSKERTKDFWQIHENAIITLESHLGAG